MDLVIEGAPVVVPMEHVASDGSAKLLRSCSLPLTGQAVVHRVITDQCVIDVTASGFEVLELARGRTREQVEKATTP